MKRFLLLLFIVSACSSPQDPCAITKANVQAHGFILPEDFPTMYFKTENSVTTMYTFDEEGRARQRVVHVELASHEAKLIAESKSILEEEGEFFLLSGISGYRYKLDTAGSHIQLNQVGPICSDLSKEPYW